MCGRVCRCIERRGAASPLSCQVPGAGVTAECRPRSPVSSWRSPDSLGWVSRERETGSERVDYYWKVQGGDGREAGVKTQGGLFCNLEHPTHLSGRFHGTPCGRRNLDSVVCTRPGYLEGDLFSFIGIYREPHARSFDWFPWLGNCLPAARHFCATESQVWAGCLRQLEPFGGHVVGAFGGGCLAMLGVRWGRAKCPCRPGDVGGCRVKGSESGQVAPNDLFGAKLRSDLGKLRVAAISSVVFGHNSRGFGRIWATFGQMWAKFGQMLTKYGRCRPNLGRGRPNWGQLWQFWPRLHQVW